MVFTLPNASLKDAENLKFVGKVGAGSEAQLAISGVTTAYAGSSIHIILCGYASGTSPGAITPLLCTAEGYLLFTATV